MSKDLEPPKHIVHPVTGEQVQLAGHPAGDLLHILELLQERAGQMKTWADAVENELVSRGADPDLYDIKEQWSREWDADDLMTTLHDLVMRDRLTLKDIDGAIVPGPPKVNGTKMKALLDRAEEDVMLELRRCFTWKRKGRARVQVRYAEIEEA